MKGAFALKGAAGIIFDIIDIIQNTPCGFFSEIVLRERQTEIKNVGFGYISTNYPYRGCPYSQKPQFHVHWAPVFQLEF
jgi:hypothetical protein